MARVDSLLPPDGQAKIVSFNSSDQPNTRLELQAHIHGREYEFVLPLRAFFDFALSDRAVGTELRDAIGVAV